MSRVWGLLWLLGLPVVHARSRGLEVRSPKRDSPEVANEDKHKFIWDGREYQRPPNMFEVNGEFKLLPEVFSHLDFEPREFQDDSTPEQQRALRDSRPWGRVYVDGWPGPIQYLRAHFGGPAPFGRLPLQLADPVDACHPLRNAESIGKQHALVVAVRGNCTFGSKAINVAPSGASGLLIVNNEPGILHAPGPDADAVGLFSAMIGEARGHNVIKAASARDTWAWVVPINCMHGRGEGGGSDSNSNDFCGPTTTEDREVVSNVAQGGFLTLPGGEEFEYLLADFGTGVPGEGEALTLEIANPADGCSAQMDVAREPAPPPQARRALIAWRGECGFVDKAQAALSSTRGAPDALLVVNSHPTLFQAGAHPRWRAANVSFPTVVVSDAAGRALQRLPGAGEAQTPSTITLRSSPSVTRNAWEELQRLEQAAGGPGGPGGWAPAAGARLNQYEELLERHAGSRERTAFIEASYAASYRGGAGDGSGGGGEGGGEAVAAEL